MDTSKIEIEALERERHYLQAMQKLKQERAYHAEKVDRIDEEIATAEDNIECGQADPDKTRLKINELQHQQIELKERMKSIDLELSQLESKTSDGSRNFDKRICIENIRELLKTSDIRIGQIEKAAGCTTGYLSRLEKEGSKSDPSVEFLLTAAKMLGVSLDLLVNGHITAMTPTEEYLLKFISRLTDDTREDKVTWEKETVVMLEKVSFDYQEVTAAHPLFEVYCTPQGCDYPEPAGTEYSSRFLEDENVNPSGNCYHANLPGMKEKIYLMCVSEAEDPLTEFYELYLINGGVNPICCTAQTCDAIKKKIENLYSEVEISASHVHINDITRNVIGRYMLDEDVLPFD